MLFVITAKNLGQRRTIQASRLHLNVTRLALERGLARGEVKMILMAQGRYSVHEASVVLDAAEAMSF